MFLPVKISYEIEPSSEKYCSTHDTLILSIAFYLTNDCNEVIGGSSYLKIRLLVVNFIFSF